MLVSIALATGLIGGSEKSPGRRTAGEPAASATPDDTSPPPTAVPASPSVMRRSVPVRLRIPAIGVDSSLMHLGLESDGTLETPPGAFPAGWFTGSPTPGQLGPAIIVGHVRYVTPGVFARLTDLRPGDGIAVKRRDGSTAEFRVTRLAHFAKSAFPTKRVYGNIDHAGLRLITCGGLDADTNVFEENVVVFADLEQS
ncbi:class F sortase [Marmoricola sp. URHB0036]|uniref:class F sortase n=1 Tax=Marmoricola sp. URHB0036 TaxID=1298863 RepID=UPI0009DBA6D0|nr:class F sortase [Marmoricola sp. URHB0036]